MSIDETPTRKVNDDNILLIVENYERLKRERGCLDELIRDLSYYLSNDVKIDNKRIYDNSGKSYSAKAATLLYHYLWSNRALSFKFETDSIDPQEKTFYEGVTSCMAHIIDFNRTNFNSALKKVIHDWNDFGFSYMMVDEDVDTYLQFSSSDIRRTWFEIDHKENPLYYYVKYSFSVAQVLSKWNSPEYINRFSQKLQDDISNNRLTARAEFLYAIKPVDERFKNVKQESHLRDIPNNQKPYKAIWIELEGKNFIDEEYFLEMPLYVVRHNARTNNRFGDGTGIDVLPSIDQLQNLWMMYYRSLELAAEPPIYLRNSSILGNNDFDRNPGAINFLNMEQMTSNVNPVGEVTSVGINAIGAYPGAIDAVKQQMYESYMIDRLLQLEDRRAATATEILEIKATRVALFSSHRDEIYRDLLTPVLKRSFLILWRQETIQKYLNDKNIAMPQSFMENEKAIADFRIDFDTNATADEREQQANNITGALTQVGQLMSLAPDSQREILQNFNIDGVTRHIAEIYNFDEDLLNPIAEIEEVREAELEQKIQQAQDERALQMAGMVQGQQRQPQGTQPQGTQQVMPQGM